MYDICHLNPWSSFEFVPAPQLDYDTFAHSEEAFTTFANACAQAGAAKCLLVSLIKNNATGCDVRTLITSTIDVSLSISVCHGRSLILFNSLP